MDLFPSRSGKWLVIGLSIFSSVATTRADTVAQYTGGAVTNISGGYVGQSFTNVSLVPESHIVFNFFTDVPAATPYALGTGFLLSQQYTGTPANLSSTTPGFLGEAIASGGFYTFAPNLTLAPGTQYFFYETADIPSRAMSGGGITYTGGQDYFSSSFTSDYMPENPVSNNFRVTGTAVPEPATWVLFALGVIVFVSKRLVVLSFLPSACKRSINLLIFGSSVGRASMLLGLILIGDFASGAYAEGFQFVQRQEFTAPVANSVAVSGDGNTALVGAIQGTSTGVAYVFIKNGKVWVEQPLSPSDGDDTTFFGISVALSRDGHTALIGAYGKNNFAGAVYVFTYDGNTWVQQQELAALDAAAGDTFGWTVALSDDGHTALIGAVNKNDSAGTAYIFRYSHNTWTQRQELVASDGAAGDNFGGAVALNGDGHVALIGADGKSNGMGAAYVFRGDAKTYTQQQKLTAFDGADYNGFGIAVALSNDGHTALIGAPNKNNMGTGAGYVFRANHNTYTLQQELMAFDGATNDYFGGSVALSEDGHIALVGAFLKNIGAGTVYVFAYEHNTYSQQQELVASDAAHGAHFAYSLSLDNDAHTAFIGANFPGSAYIFQGH